MEGGLNYESYKQNALNFYSNVRKVFSPALNQNIHFTSEGFNHILFKGSRLERERSSQILRFKLLPLAIKLLEIATTFQEYEQTIKDFQVMNYKKRSIKSKLISYWGVIGIIEGRKIKVIIRQVGENGQLHFWSVIPNWMTNKYRDMRIYTTMSGDPEKD
jgi:hypothetical protein